MALDGVVIVNKEEGLSSQAVVNRVKRIFGVTKAGHTGTLDPMATGVLPVLIGRGVKASEFMLSSDKHYIATLRLGLTTDTEDIWGTVLTTSDTLPTEGEVMAAISRFVGEIMQTPPMYSALKVGGKKLCDLAREGKTIDRQARKITVYSIVTERLSDNEYRLDIHCSKGTYIRTLCKDIGESLGVGGVMSSLCRGKSAGFFLSDAKTLSALEAMSEEERLGTVYPVEHIFKDWTRVDLPQFFERLALSGQEIYLHKIGATLPLGYRVALYGSDGFFAIGEVRQYEGGLAIKPIRQFKV